MNGSGGRDHYPARLLAGLGRRRLQERAGLRLVELDRQRARDDPIRIEDVLTTVYHQIGINADKELMSAGPGRSRSSTGEKW